MQLLLNCSAKIIRRYATSSAQIKSISIRKLRFISDIRPLIDEAMVNFSNFANNLNAVIYGFLQNTISLSFIKSQQY